MILRKSNVLARLQQIKYDETEGLLNNPDPNFAGDSDFIAKRILDLLLDYVNDQQIREAVDAIPF